MKEYIKKQPASLLLIALIWIVCMIPVPETPLSHVRFIDKWTHLAMYGTLTLVIMWEYGTHHGNINWKRFAIGAIIAPICMGGLVELAQRYLTCGIRSGEWLDFLANTTGVMIGCLIGIPLARYHATRNKGD